MFLFDSILLLFDVKLNSIRWVAFVFRLALSNFISEVQIILRPIIV